MEGKRAYSIESLKSALVGVFIFAAAVAGLAALSLSGCAPGTDDSSLSAIDESAALAEDNGGAGPKITDIVEYDVRYADVDGQLPEGTEVVEPKGVATVQTKDGASVQAIAGTMVFALGNRAACGLFAEEDAASAADCYAFTAMASFTVSDPGNYEYESVLDISGSAGDSSSLTASNDAVLLFMRTDGRQGAMSYPIADIKQVDFDWEGSVSVNEYALLQESEGAFVAVPQNALFLVKHYVGFQGYNFYNIYFGLVIGDYYTVPFPDIQQAAIYRRFICQDGSSEEPFDGYGVELVMKGGEAYKRDLILDAYGFGTLAFASSDDVQRYEPGEWLSIQHVGALP